MSADNWAEQGVDIPDPPKARKGGIASGARESA